MSGERNPFRTKYRKYWIGGILFWAVLTSLLAFPSVKKSVDNQAKIADLDSRINSLAEWTAAPNLPDSSVAGWRRNLESRWNSLFPDKKEVEDLFYVLARSANHCGIDPIQVQMKESSSRRRQRQPPPDDESSDGEGDGDEELLDQLSLSSAFYPSSNLKTNVLQVHFSGEFADVAEFLDALRRIPRALKVTSFELKENVNEVTVDMELEYYVQSRF